MGVQYPPPPQPPAQNNNRTIIIVVVVVLVLCCCCCIGSLAYLFWTNRAEIMQQIEQNTSALPYLRSLA